LTIDPKSYEHWRNALQSDSPGLLDVPAGVAVAGFYRASNTGRPVAVWPNGDGEMVARVGATGAAQEPDAQWCERVFAYCQPVSEEDYRQACATGVWSDHHVAPHNRPPEGLDNITAMLDDLRMEAHQMIKREVAKDQAEADRAANLVARIEGLIQALTAEQQQAVAPILDLIRTLDGKRTLLEQQLQEARRPYTEKITPAMETVKKLKLGFIGNFLIKVRQAARAAIAQTGGTDLGSTSTNRATGAVSVTTNAGAKGAKVTLVTRWFAVIEDKARALDHFKDHPDILATLQKLCDAAARSRARTPVPGVKFDSKDVPR